MELEPAILLRTSACLEAGFHVDLPHVRLAAEDRCEEKQRCDVISLRRRFAGEQSTDPYSDKNDAACVGMGPQPIARLMYGAVPGRPEVDLACRVGLRVFRVAGAAVMQPERAVTIASQLVRQQPKRVVSMHSIPA